MITERIVNRKRAWLIIALLLVVLAASISAVGYKMYTVTQARRPQVEKDEAAILKNIRKNPRNLRLHLDLAKVYYRQDKKESALRECQKALSIDKNCVEAIYYTGLIAIDNKEYKSAERQMKKVLKLAPADKGAALALARIYRDSGQTAKAVEQYRDTLRDFPAAADALSEFGMVLEKQGKKEEAIRQYREALRFVPDYKPAQAGLARLDKS